MGSKNLPHPVYHITYLPWHCHSNNLTKTRVVESIEACDFATVHITTPLGHHTNAPLRIWCLKRIDIVHKRWLCCYFKITNYTVTLKQITRTQNILQLPVYRQIKLSFLIKLSASSTMHIKDPPYCEYLKTSNFSLKLYRD